MEENHAAIVARIDVLNPIPNADRIQLAYVLGVPVIVGKDSQVGDIGVLFDGELQLSHEFVHYNNLYANTELNNDCSKKGYFGENRRVRVQKFRGVKSEGFFTSLESLEFTGYNISKLSVGDSFSSLNKIPICSKYMSRKTLKAIDNRNKSLIKSKVKVASAPLFKEHMDTKQFRYNVDSIPEGSLITIESKWHGTSGRSSYTKIKKLYSIWKFPLQAINNIRLNNKYSRRIFNKFKNVLFGYINGTIGTIFEPIFFYSKWDYVTGTRRCVLFNEHENKEGFHGSEQFRHDITNKLKPYLVKGMTVYYEIVGYANGNPIMGIHNTSTLNDKKFTEKYSEQVIYKYRCAPNEYKIKIYRITLSSEDGESIDFSSQQIQTWAETRGLLAATPIIPRFIYDGDKEKLINLVEELTERPDKLTEDYYDPSHISEGVVVRVENGDITPKFFKHKSFAFKVMEGIFKENSVDLEDIS